MNSICLIFVTALKYHIFRVVKGKKQRILTFDVFLKEINICSFYSSMPNLVQQVQGWLNYFKLNVK